MRNQRYTRKEDRAIFGEIVQMILHRNRRTNALLLSAAALSLCGSLFSTPLRAQEFSPIQEPGTTSSSGPSVVLPEKLRSGIANFLTTPFHFRIRVTSALLPAEIIGWGAVDPINKESEATAKTEFFAGISATASSLTIGEQAWYRTSPPGGAYRKGVIPVQIPQSIPWQKIQPYLTDVVELPGESIHGIPTTPFQFTVNGKGLIELNKAGASLPIGSVRAASGTIYLSITAPYYPQQVVLQETIMQSGYQYTLTEIINYENWGEELHLSPPA